MAAATINFACAISKVTLGRERRLPPVDLTSEERIVLSPRKVAHIRRIPVTERRVTVFHDENQNWEEQLQERASALLAHRFSALEADVRRLQSSLNETCERLLGQTSATLNAEEADSLRQNFQQALNAARATAEQDFQTQLARAREEAADGVRQETEAQLRELHQQLENSRHEIEISRQSLSVGTGAGSTAGTDASFGWLKTAIEEIDSQRTQSDALTTLVHHAAHFAPRIVFFVVKSGVAMGWKATGFTNGLNDEAVRALSVPINADTLLREALDRQSTSVGGPYSHHENGTILGRYGAPAAEQAIAIPLVVRGKAAAVLYADAGASSGSAINLEALEALVRVTSLAIELLPVRRGAEQTRPTAPQAQAAPPPAPTVTTPPPSAMPTVFYGGMGDEPPASVQPSFQVETAHQSFAQTSQATAPAPPAPPVPSPVVEERAEYAVAATARTTGESSTAETTSPPEVTNEAEVRAHNDARRFARLLVSEIKLYNEAKVSEGRRNQDLYERLKDDIDRSRQMYEKRVSPLVAAKFDYFYDELVHTLGEGDSAKLGTGCPGPTVSV